MYKTHLLMDFSHCIVPFYDSKCVCSYIQLDRVLSLCAYSFGVSLASSRGNVAMMLSSFFLKRYSYLHIKQLNN